MSDLDRSPYTGFLLKQLRTLGHVITSPLAQSDACLTSYQSYQRSAVCRLDSRVGHQGIYISFGENLLHVYAKNKGADQLHGIRPADQRLFSLHR